MSFVWRQIWGGGGKDIRDPRGIVSGPGPMALCYREKLGWVTGSLGPKSGHW